MFVEGSDVNLRDEGKIRHPGTKRELGETVQGSVILVQV